MSGARLAIGLMSGTSMDGVDVALIETDGTAVQAFGPTQFRPYADRERAAIRAALVAGPTLSERWERPDVVAEAERIVTEAHLDAVEEFLALSGLSANEIAVVGFHGQTIFHAPDRGLTVQIGDGLALARGLGIPVVYDFRAADVAGGGQGAPLVPVFHAALVAKARLTRPVAVLNIGGVANLTWIGGTGEGAGDLVAFDTGPGNALIDDWCLENTGRPIDADGRLAAEGKVDEARLAKLMAHPYFAAEPPKSLDRNAFSRAACDGLSPADGAATLAAFTAAAVARGLAHLPARPHSIVVAGGGAHNATLVSMLATRTGARILGARDVGWSTDFLEAQAFAYLAVRTLEGLPLSFPGTTGVKQPCPGGVVAKP